MKDKKNTDIAILAILIIVLIGSVIYLGITVKRMKLEVNKESSLVSTVYYNEFNNEDGSIYTYDIPKINLEFDNAKKINTEIYDTCRESVELVTSGMGGADMLIDYNYYINSNILSLVVRKQSWAAGAESFLVYNIDVNTGKTVTNKELVKSLEINEEEFVKKLKELCKSAGEVKNGVSLDKEDINYALETCDINIPMFIDEFGNINVVMYVPSTSGAAGYNYILSTNIMN